MTLKFKITATISGVFLFLFLLGTFQTTHANFEQDRQSYQESYTHYRQLYQDYRIARSEYLTYQTLISKTQVIYATRQMLLTRNLVLDNYLQMLSSRIQQTSDAYLPPENKQLLLEEINRLRGRISETNLTIENSQELQNFESVSRSIDLFIEQVNQLGYQVQAHIIISQSRELLGNANQVVSVANDQVIRISNEGKIDTDQIERWLIDAEERMNLAETSHQQAEEMVDQVVDKRGLDELRTQIRRSQQYIKNANQRLKEIITAIRVQ